MLRKIVLLICIFVLSGCSAFIKEKEVKVVEFKTIIVAPPDELLVYCFVEPPPNIDEYLNSSWSDKEDLLINHAGVQMKNLINCNKMIKSLSDWKQQQLDLYNKPVK